MNITNAMDKGEKPQPIDLLKAPKMNIRETRQIIMIWPASMLANNRIINAKGFVNMPRNSTSTKMGLTPPGTGGLKICPQ